VTLDAIHTGVVQHKSIAFACFKARKFFTRCFLAPKQPSFVKIGNQCAWQPVSKGKSVKTCGLRD
jgi:hypothetical protein